MKEPTKVKMGIAKTLDKLQALHRMVVAILDQDQGILYALGWPERGPSGRIG
jgi:hypothetical protein